MNLETKSPSPESASPRAIPEQPGASPTQMVGTRAPDVPLEMVENCHRKVKSIIKVKMIVRREVWLWKLDMVKTMRPTHTNLWLWSELFLSPNVICQNASHLNAFCKCSGMHACWLSYTETEAGGLPEPGSFSSVSKQHKPIMQSFMK